MGINELLIGKDDRLDYSALISKYPWIIKNNQKCILSPDSDGLLCGLFMSHFLNWEIVGYYDGKVLLLQEGVSAYDENCIFLDMEVFRAGIKSVGHHMVALNNRHLPDNWEENYKQCIQPNNMRGYDKNKNFRLKYPLATIHLLLGIIGHTRSIAISKSSIAPLFFADGTFNVLFSYPENVLNWLAFLGISQNNNPLKAVFQNDHYTIHETMQVMDDFFRKRDKLNRPGERGDKFVISNNKGEFKNVTTSGKGLFKIDDQTKLKTIEFIRILAGGTGWNYNPNKWSFDRLKKYKFTKNSFQTGGMTLTIKNFENFLQMNPLSWAITSSQNIEFTLETPDSLP